MCLLSNSSYSILKSLFVSTPNDHLQLFKANQWDKWRLLLLCVLIRLYNFFGWAFRSLLLFWFCCCKSPARGYVNTVTDTEANRIEKLQLQLLFQMKSEVWCGLFLLFHFFPSSYVSLPLIIMELFMAANVGEIMRGDRERVRDFSALFNIKAEYLSGHNQTIFCCCCCWSVSGENGLSDFDLICLFSSVFFPWKALLSFLFIFPCIQCF